MEGSLQKKLPFSASNDLRTARSVTKKEPKKINHGLESSAILMDR